MALINCPECGKKISDKAHNCPNCGYPVENDFANKTKYDITIISFGSDHNKIIKTMRFLREILNISLTEVAYIQKNLPYKIFSDISDCEVNKIKKSLLELGCKIIISQHIGETLTSDNNKITNYYENENKVKCPRCGSTQVAVGQRGYSFITGFFGSNKTVNRCGKCGFSWKP